MKPVFVFFVLFILFCFSSVCDFIPAYAHEEEDWSRFGYYLVEVQGRVERNGDELFIKGNNDRVIEAESKICKLHEGNYNLVGIFRYSSQKGDKKAVLDVLKLEPMETPIGEKVEFSIKLYEGTIQLVGKKAREVWQHPIDTHVSHYIDYFDCPLGQLVVYFKDEQTAMGFVEGKELILEGKLRPQFASSKRPVKKGEVQEKVFYEFYMIVERVGQK